MYQDLRVLSNNISDLFDDVKSLWRSMRKAHVGEQNKVVASAKGRGDGSSLSTCEEVTSVPTLQTQKCASFLV